MNRPATTWDDVKNVARGVLMGGADIIPGVSGGTVALIVGIYERLVTAISHVDLTLFGHIKAGRWKDAAEHLDLRFLITLGIGIGSGIVGLASLMNHLLVNHPTPTSAVFFGLILASCVIVAKMVQEKNALTLFLGVVGTVASFFLVGLLPGTPPEGLGYVFLCGMIAICAMILPGISGAFILLLMGKYTDITGSIRDVIHLRDLSVALPNLIVFAIGCLLGLIGFSKFLRWLLVRHESATTALLCGFMLGSLRKIWPFKQDLTPDVEKLKLKVYENVAPDFSATETWFAIGLAVVAFLAVLLLDHFSKTPTDEPPLHAEPESEAEPVTEA